MNTVTIKVAGVEYNLKGRENSDYLVNVANYVDGKIKEISINNNKLSTSSVAVLSALNIADELFKAEEEVEGLVKKRNSLEERHSTLRERLKELKDEMENSIANKGKEVDSLKEYIKLKEDELLEMEQLRQKVKELQEKTKEMNSLQNKVDSLREENFYYKDSSDNNATLAKELKEKNIELSETVSMLQKAIEIDYKPIEDYNELQIKLEDQCAENIKLKERINDLEMINSTAISSYEYEQIHEKAEKLKQEVAILESTNKDLRYAIEDSYIKITDLEEKVEVLTEENKELINAPKPEPVKIIDETLLKEKEELQSELLIIEEEAKKLLQDKEKLQSVNKEVKFQLQNSKYKILDLENKLLDVQINLAKEKNKDKPFLKR